MYCKECGKPIDDDSKFCRYCGKNLSEIIKNPQQKTNEDILISKETHKSNEAESIKKESSIDSQTLKNTYHTPKNEKYDESYEKEPFASFIGALTIIGVPLIGNELITLNESHIGFYIIIFIWRILATIWIVNIATRQNRDTFGWGVFGFLTPGIALLIIGLQKKINIPEKTKNNLNNDNPKQEIIVDNNIIEEKRKKYKIEEKDGVFYYKQYKYDKLKYAIEYAELEETKNKTSQ
jgi:hypothetical protein